VISGSCLCGAVTFEVPTVPTEVTTCNCTACRKLGPLWAYYDRAKVRISGETVGFERHDIPGQDGPMLAFHHCPTCGCVTHWADLTPTEARMAVNARLMAPEIVEAAGLRRFDGAGSWSALDTGP
jgi:hypothetical protein